MRIYITETSHNLHMLLKKNMMHQPTYMSQTVNEIGT